MEVLLHVCMSVHRMPKETRGGISSSGTDREPPHVLWDESEPLEEQPVLLLSVAPFPLCSCLEPRLRGTEERGPPCSVLSFAVGLPSCFRVTTVISPGAHLG